MLHRVACAFEYKNDECQTVKRKETGNLKKAVLFRKSRSIGLETYYLLFVLKKLLLFVIINYNLRQGRITCLYFSLLVEPEFLLNSVHLVRVICTLL